MRASVEKKPINQDQVPSFISLVLLFARLNDILFFFSAQVQSIVKMCLAREAA